MRNFFMYLGLQFVFVFLFIGPVFADESRDFYFIGDDLYYDCPDGDKKASEEFDIDKDSFEVIDKYFSKDKNKLYFKAVSVRWRSCILVEIDYVDLESFEVVNYNYQKDKNNVYVTITAYNNSYVSKIEGSDPATFRLLEDSYAVDKDIVYKVNPKNFNVIRDADVSSFEPLENGYSKDNSQVYYYGETLNGISSNSFGVLTPYVVKDDSAVFVQKYDNGLVHYKLLGADPETIEVFEDNDLKDKNYIFRAKKISGKTDYLPESEVVIEGEYSWKDSGVYFQGKSIGNKIEGYNANPIYFEVIKFPYSKDNKSVYYFWDAIPGEVDMDTFEILDNDYSKDKNRIYYKNSMVEGADVNTFKLNYKNDYQAEDNDGYYVKGLFLRKKNGNNIQSNADSQLFNRLKGKIILKVEDNGKAYYLNPKTSTTHYLGRPVDAFNVMREQGIGISEKDFNSFNDYAPSRLSGTILLRVEAKGEAYFVNPDDLKMHYLGRPADAFNVMRNLGLGISNNDFDDLGK